MVWLDRLWRLLAIAVFWGLPGDFDFGRCCCLGFCVSFTGCFRVVRGRFCARWFLSASANIPACSRGWVFIALSFCGIEAVWRVAYVTCFALASCCLANSAFSSKQNLFVFSRFCLCSPTVLLATMRISRGFSSGSRGFVSVIIARSFFVTTVFFGYQYLSILCGGSSS